MACVLIVDDDQGTRDTFAAILGLAGHTSRVAATASEGLALAMAQRHDLILVDLRMPDFSGLELLAETHTHMPETPVVIVTAFATSAVSSASIQLGAKALAEKPIEESTLLALVHTYAEQSSHPSDTTGSVGPEDANHSATRWALIVASVVGAAYDVRTIDDWAIECGHSQATIKRWCSNAGVRASRSLDFGRAFRIVVKYANRKCRWFEVLAIAAPTTMNAFMCQSGFSFDANVPDVMEFVRRQRFISDPKLIRELVRSLTVH